MSRRTAIIHVTKSGRRWASCPNCIAVSAPLSKDATSRKCRHCETEFDLVDAKAPKPRKSRKPTSAPEA
jgi:hypothetical protein